MPFSEKLSKFLFIVSIITVGLGGAFSYGVLAYMHELQPVPAIRATKEMLEELFDASDRILQTDQLLEASSVEIHRLDALQPGLVMVAGIEDGRNTSVKIIDRAGNVFQEWLLVWSEVWPDGEGDFPASRLPEKGMYLHGLDILPDGSLVANFEHLSTFRIDVCSRVNWKLDNLGHHAVHFAYDDTVWVTAEELIESGPTGYPLHEAPLRSWTLQQLDQEGKVMRDISVFDILVENDLMGLLYMSSLKNSAPYVVLGDTLHLNDVDVFPDGIESTVFSPGDLMLSLRNINAVLVVEPDSLKLKFMTIGGVVRHHDPDFLPGDRISIFDNRNFTIASGYGPAASRIVEINARTGEQTVVLDGSIEEPFFTNIMGTHERLTNGNILVNESDAGRLLEYTASGELVWRYDNRLSNGRNGRTFIGMVLPANMDEMFFDAQKEACK